MQKYFHAISTGFQNNLAYRFNFLTRTLFGFIPLTAIIMLWRSIYEGKPADAATVATYTLSQMISYYLIVTIVDALTAVNDHDDWGSSRDPKTDPDTYKDNGGKSDWGDRDGGGNDSWGGGHEKPSGGMHTGGGALATPTTTAGGLAVLAVAATGLYAVRRKRPAGNPA